MQERSLKAKYRNSDDVSTEGYSCAMKSSKSSHEMHNDDISTVAYSNQEHIMTQEKELDDILKDISHLSDTIAESISTEYSGDKFVLLMNSTKKENDTVESEKNDKDLEQESKNMMENIMNIFGSPKEDGRKVSQNGRTVSNCESSTEEEEHEERTCMCHVPEHLKFALDLIESKDVLLPLIKKWISAMYWSISYLCSN